MLVWRHHMYSEERIAHKATGDRLTIGRSPECDITLPSAYVPRVALIAARLENGWEIEACVSGGCELSELPLGAGERVPLHEGAEFRVAPYVLKFELYVEDNAAPDEDGTDDQIAELIRAVHARLLDTLGAAETNVARDRGAEDLLRLEHAIDEIAIERGLLDLEFRPRLRRLAGHALRNILIDRVIGDTATHDPINFEQRRWTKLVSAVEEREKELLNLAKSVEAQILLSGTMPVPKRMALIEQRFWACWDDRVNPLHEFVVYLATKEIKKQVKDIVFGYGAIEDLLRLPTISEIMVVGHDHIFVEKRLKSGGTIENSGRRFVSEADAMGVIEQIVNRCNRRINHAQPMVDARLDDGSRVNAVISPVSVTGPILTIRKFPHRQHRIGDWIDAGGLTPMAASFLRAAVRGRRNILISGGTGAGKTTLLNCLADWINDRERVVTIEDTAELQLAHDHVVPLQSRPPNTEQQGQVSIGDLLRNALRMRPDRIVVGECRGAEALDMLNAMNTGHDGSMTTLHANSPFEVPERLESMVKAAADFSERAVHQQIASAIDIIVQVERYRDYKHDGDRRIVCSIAEVRPLDEETGRVEVLQLFSIPPDSDDAQLRPTGRLPSFGAELLNKGLLDLEVFCPGIESQENHA